MPPFIILFFIIGSSTSFGQWIYVNAIENSLDNTFSKYEIWLKNNDYHIIHQYDVIAKRKAETMGAIYNTSLSCIVYESKSQPTKIYCYINSKQVLKNIDVFLVNPAPGEFENTQLVLLKSSYKLISESKNQKENFTRTYFQKKNIRLNISFPDDKSYLTISAGTLSNYE